MKKLRLVSTAIITVFFFALSGATTVMAEDILRIVFSQPGHFHDELNIGSRTAEKWKELVETRSDGKIELQLYGTGELYKSYPEMKKGLMVGTLDMADLYLTTLSREAPFYNAVALPGIFGPDVHEAAKAFYNFMKSEGANIMQEQLEAKGAHLIAAYLEPYPGSRFRFKEKWTLEQLKGKKIRVPGAKKDLVFTKELGMVPTPISWGETYMALRQGVVDGCSATDRGYVMSKVYEVAPYTLDRYIAMGPTGYVANMKFWNKLTKEQKALITQATLDAIAWAQENYGQRILEAYKKELTEKAGGFYTFSKEDNLKWDQAARVTKDFFVKELDMQHVMDAMRQYIPKQ